jgi:carboxymethylenebutenolidase
MRSAILTVIAGAVLVVWTNAAAGRFQARDTQPATPAVEGTAAAARSVEHATADQDRPDYVAQLEAYSGHGEWVKYAGEGGDEVTAYIAFPERPDPAPAMIVIHEIFGLSDWVRTVTHDLAEAGYVAIAPDLLSRRGGTEGADNARTLIRDLPPDSITVDLNATADYLRSLESVRGESIGVIGFCWGGSQTFRYATNNPDLKAAVVCYGGAPDADAMGLIQTPILGVYAENDARINAALPDVEEAMSEAGKSYEYEIYPGANHGFLRSRNVPEEADRAWQDIVAFLGKNLGK